MKHPHNEALNRLKFFRKSLMLSQQELAETIGFTQANYSRIESRGGQISYQLVAMLIEIHQLNPVWLFTGEGEMYYYGEGKTLFEVGEEEAAELQERVKARKIEQEGIGERNKQLESQVQQLLDQVQQLTTQNQTLLNMLQKKI